MARDSAPFTVTVQPSVPVDASWVPTVPQIQFMRGVPESRDLPTLYATNYNPTNQDVEQEAGTPVPVDPAARVEGVRITNEGVLSYDGSGSGDAQFTGVQLNIVDTVVPGSWAARSTTGRVIWAHDFSESDAEVNLFTRNGDIGGTNQPVSSLPNPITRVPSGLGSSMAIRCTVIGTTFPVATPSGTAGDIHTISVNDASQFIDPATVGGSYIAIIGGRDVNDGDACWEKCHIIGRNVAAKTLTIRRRIDSSSIPRINGVEYPYPQAPSYPIGFSIGLEQTGSWNRPFAAFPAGQNGKALSDIGARNGAARFVRTWPTTPNNDGHFVFREAYYGHRYYWDTSYNPAAAFVNWNPPEYPTYTRYNAFEGDEFWLQWRVKYSAARLSLPMRKSMFIQNASGSGAGQIYMLIGARHWNEQPPPAERIAGVTYGSYTILSTNGGDSRSAGLGGLLDGVQTDENGSGDIKFHTDPQYTLTENNKNGPNSYAFCMPADTWVTFMIHMKPARDHGEDYFPDGIYTQAVPKPYKAATDPTYQTTVELFAALPGWTHWSTLSSATNLVWGYGNSIGNWGYLAYDAPGMNTFWMSPNMNMYPGSGSVPPPPIAADCFYTQAILSKDPIAIPVD